MGVINNQNKKQDTTKTKPNHPMKTQTQTTAKPEGMELGGQWGGEAVRGK